jgi:hypothetical protein
MRPSLIFYCYQRVIDSLVALLCVYRYAKANRTIAVRTRYFISFAPPDVMIFERTIRRLREANSMRTSSFTKRFASVANVSCLLNERMTCLFAGSVNRFFSKENELASHQHSVLDHQTCVLDDLDAGLGKSPCNIVVAYAELKPNGLRFFGENVVRMLRNIRRPAKYIN